MFSFFSYFGDVMTLVLLRKVRNDKMFSFVHRTWNPVRGCLHDCIYCWGKRLARRLKYDYKPQFIPKRLNIRFKPGELIFVCDFGDLFGDWVPSEWIEKILDVIKKHKETYFLLLTKNPKRYLEFSFPENVILGATIETDIDNDYGKISKAPKPSERIALMQKINHKYKMISIEPILDFSRDFPEQLARINPCAIVIGYDNYNCKLPEPRLEKTLWLIRELEKRGIHVIRKTIRKAWYE